jgi:N-acetylmuramic acid 6-phosphate etherase
VGPMALAGSTRMQASTVLQLAIGLAMLTQYNENQMRDFLSEMQSYITTDASTFLKPFIEKESAEYLAGRFILYCVKDYSITVFTDTTERAPTFSLTPFSHRKAERLLKLSPSKCYICIPEAKTNEEAWQKLLLRPPRLLNWREIDERTCGDYLKEFDFSTGAKEFRKWLTKDTEHSDFEIFRHEETILWRLQDHEAALMLPENTSPLFEHTLLKMLLNIHSTLIMGRLGRYRSNMMTWVYPTNGKLIDRASRYVKTLLHEEGIEVDYAQVVEALFATRKRITGNESIVLATFEELKKSYKP